MFDYHAGEKYKLTLIMTGMAGLMAGMFFSVLFLGDAQPQEKQTRQRPKWADHPDVTGVPRSESQQAQGTPESPAGQQQGQAPAQPYVATDQTAALSLIEQWLPIAWDLSAGSAGQSQATAIQYMTADCAAAYQQNVWTPEIATQIEQAGLKSNFSATSVQVGSIKPDGGVVILVTGQQVLTVPGKGDKARPVNLEYLVKQTTNGLR
ncbi:MAG: hypothetical protein K8F91_21560, partial [Candidatus Obscuribacterales bacterium]|nr:hypothetical protein [Candidatus Obscuribacterales bacterium]